MIGKNIGQQIFLLSITSILFLFTVNISLAQIYNTATAVPFLTISPSPEANGQGCTSVSRITDDPFAINQNPAHLGLTSLQSNISISFYPGSTKWLPGSGLGNDFTYNSVVLRGGMNLEKYLDIPFAVGIAYSRVYLGLGTLSVTMDSPEPTGTFEAEEHFDAFSIGAGLDIGVKLAAGATFRRTVSNLAPGGTAEERVISAPSIWSGDIGFLFYAPVFDIIEKEYKYCRIYRL